MLLFKHLVALGLLVWTHWSPMTADEEQKWLLVANLTVILFPYLALVCITAAFNATLNVFQRFTEPALSPIWLNLAMIFSLAGAGLRFSDTPLGIMRWLCAGVLLGGVVQMTVPAAVLMRAGWRPRFDLRLSPSVRQIGGLMAPGFFGTAIYQVNITVSGLLAYAVNDSAATLMFYANRLMELPIGVFAIAISTVVYPLISKHAVEKKFAELNEDFRKGIRLILIINVPAAIGLALLSGPIVRVLYLRGEFTAAQAHDMGPLVALFAIGMPFFSVVNLTVRAFYALKDTATPVKIAVIDFVVNVVLSLLLMHWLGAAGLVLASTAAIIVQTLLLQRALSRRLPASGHGTLLISIAKVVGAAVVMGGVVWAGWRGWQALGWTQKHTDVAALLTLIPFGACAYGAVLLALRIEGREELAVLVRKFRKRKT